jgi:HTH-type transcriptional regulator/antitoxin MqsA
MTMMRTCLNCQTSNGMTRFEDEALTIEQAGMTRIVEGLSGRRCGTCGGVEFDADSARRYAAAGDALVRSEREALEWIEAVSEFDNDAVL